jgi:hypothetical protein
LWRRRSGNRISSNDDDDDDDDDDNDGMVKRRGAGVERRELREKKAIPISRQTIGSQQCVPYRIT